VGSNPTPATNALNGRIRLSKEVEELKDSSASFYLIIRE
jgi:hypothetical protein